MIPELIKTILAAYAIVTIVTIFAGVGKDSIPNGTAISFKDWQAKNYRGINGKYYRIHPPNEFESERQRRKQYRRYCLDENRRSCNG